MHVQNGVAYQPRSLQLGIEIGAASRALWMLGVSVVVGAVLVAGIAATALAVRASI
jgi:hypothetical protein